MRSPGIYPASAYDEQMCLKPTPFLWLAVLYFSRALTLPLVMALGHFAGVDVTATVWLRGLWSAEGLLPSAIAAVVLYAMFRRTPMASTGVRWAWAHGRWLLAVSGLLDIGLLLSGPIRSGELDDQALASGAAALVDCYFLAYVLIAPRVAQVFAEFPARPAPSE